MNKKNEIILLEKKKKLNRNTNIHTKKEIYKKIRLF